MFRAELGNGYRDRAVALLARLQERYAYLFSLVSVIETFMKAISCRCVQSDTRNHGR